MLPLTQFTDPAAVDAWDSWFRWRDDSGLRDLTIDATWWRVAHALAAVDGGWAPLLAHHFVNAFSRWWLLPDERLLQAAGTGTRIEALDRPMAVLNAAAFVTTVPGSPPRFARERFMATAGLAVRLLDNAVMLYGPAQAPAGLSIGVIGLVDALQDLGCPLPSEEAPNQAREIAMALAEGCLRGAVMLADERGSRIDADERRHLADLWRERGMPASLIQEALQQGVRHAALTAIRPHPRLALLANNVTDGISARRVTAPVSALPAGASAQTEQAMEAACRGLAAAMQPWVDATVIVRNGRERTFPSPSRQHGRPPLSGISPCDPSPA